MTGASTGRPTRYVTGQPDPFTGDVFPVTGTFPFATQLMTLDASPVAVTATNADGDTTNTWLTLSSSNFDTKFLRFGTYIYLQSLINKVIGVSSDGVTIQLEKAFPSAVTDADVYVVRQMGSKRVQATSNGTVDAILQGWLFPVGEVSVFGGILGVEAISYDSSADGAQISFDITE